ncbi:hypothetical protein BV20DRAFT_1050328 [Pilatotrama ljubarskyi]|nr:hypothetical protein BV20DRAFT_1050328 [Pilatotrama ljubarskyi]
MKAVITALSLVALAFAQSVTILSPAPGTTLSAGESFVVDIDKADSLSPSYDVSVAIGLQSCGETPCSQLASAGILGNVLHAGDFTPQLRPNSSHLFQNYSVQVPSTMQTGPAVLTVGHFYLLGAGASPVVETVNATIVIQ